MKRPLVSAIVPTYNSQATIVQCLESLKKQTYRPIEIIVVDCNSSDKTRQIARRYTPKVYIHGPERAAQMNFGIFHARGKYVYRVDSDFIVEPDVVRQCIENCKRNHLDGIAVHNTSAEGLGFWAEVRKLERNTYIDDALIVAVRFFSKRAWKQIGGFDETLYGPEDYDFHNRFVYEGFRWGRIKAIERHLGEPKTLVDIYRKHYWYGKQMLFYFRKHPAIFLLQSNPIRSSYFRHYKTFLNHPTLFLGLFIMIAIKFSAGGLGFLTAFLTDYKPDFYNPKNKK